MIFGEVVHGIEDRLDEIAGVFRIPRCTAGRFHHALNSPFLTILIYRFDESIREGNHQVTGIELNGTNPIFRISEQPNWRATGFESTEPSRRMMTGGLCPAFT